MRKFECTQRWSKTRTESWTGLIVECHRKDGTCEILIESRSSIRAVIGKTTSGRYVCIPEMNAGCWLSEPGDLFYNTEKLSRALKNKVDGITVACAIQRMEDLL